MRICFREQNWEPRNLSGKKGESIQSYIIKLVTAVGIGLIPLGDLLRTCGKCTSHKVVYVLEYLSSFLRDSTPQWQESLHAGSE